MKKFFCDVCDCQISLNEATTNQNIQWFTTVNDKIDLNIIVRISKPQYHMCLSCLKKETIKAFEESTIRYNEDMKENNNFDDDDEF